MVKQLEIQFLPAASSLLVLFLKMSGFESNQILNLIQSQNALKRNQTPVRIHMGVEGTKFEIKREKAEVGRECGNLMRIHIGAERGNKDLGIKTTPEAARGMLGLEAAKNPANIFNALRGNRTPGGSS
ncbi:hypothetical protein B0H14DRAFT_2612175 [Mycena olivaceomarginata]|nr:hypothetical protein B0H14DRAFT_2612175 [Mycena olivaceomarginata]